MPLGSMLDLRDDPLPFVRTTVQHQPAWALRKRAAEDEDDQPDDRANTKRATPADVRR